MKIEIDVSRILQGDILWVLEYDIILGHSHVIAVGFVVVFKKL